MVRGVRVDASEKLVECDAAVSRAVRDLVDVERSVGWKRVIRVAEVVARHFLGGDASRATCANRVVKRSIRRLAAHPDCPLSRTRLAELIGAYNDYRANTRLRASKLTPSHVAAVVGLVTAERKMLLDLAVAETLSVRELKQRARAVRRCRVSRPRAT